MNRTQRQGLFSASALAAIIIFLHFPFDGYTVQHEVITRYGTGQCPRLSIEEIYALTAEQSNLIFEKNRLCNSESELQIRPFQQWASDSPLFPWFGSTLHALVTLLLVGGMGIAWFFIFRDAPRPRTSEAQLRQTKTDVPVKDKETGL